MPLVDQQNIIARYVPVNANFDPTVITGSLSVAKDILLGFIPVALYDRIANKYNDDPNSLDADENVLLERIEEVLVRLAFWDYSRDGQLEISTSGFHTNTTETRKTPWQWQIEDTRANLKFTGYQAIQKLLVYLYQDPSLFTEWTNSNERVQHTKRIFLDAAEFSRFHNIQDNFCVFHEMRDSIRAVEENVIRKVISDDLFDEIVDQIFEGTLSINNASLLNLIKPVLAKLAVVDAIPGLATLMSQAGIIEAYTSERQSMRATAPARAELISLLIRQAADAGRKAQIGLEKYLYANHSTYPLYEASSAYTDQLASNEAESDETTSQKIFNAY